MQEDWLENKYIAYSFGTKRIHTESYVLLMYDVASGGDEIPTFRRNQPPLS